MLHQEASWLRASMYQTHELQAICSTALGPISSRPAGAQPADALTAGSSRVGEVGGPGDETLPLRLAVLAESVGAGERGIFFIAASQPLACMHASCTACHRHHGVLQGLPRC